MYICTCQTNYPAHFAGENRKFAFVKGGARKRPPRLVVRPDNPKAKAFFIVKLTMLHSDKNGTAFCKAVQIIHAIAELDTAFTKAEAVASTNSWIWEQFTGNRTETMAALGLALHTELSTIYEEEQV